MSQQYIAKELTHFTKQQAFHKILEQKILLGGPNVEGLNEGSICYSSYYRNDISQNDMIEVNKVCFCDIPAGQTEIHMKKYGNYGIAFHKDFIVKKGGIPVHYLPRDATINSRWADAGETRASFFDRMTKELYEYFNNLISESIQNSDGDSVKYQKLHAFIETQIKPFFQFFDHSLSDDDRDNYYFEREWRVVGNIKFKLNDVKRVFLPQEDESSFRAKYPNYKGKIKVVWRIVQRTVDRRQTTAK